MPKEPFPPQNPRLYPLIAARQLREDLRREAQRLSRAEEDGKMALAKGQRELQRGRDAVREEEKQVEALREEAEAAQAEAREAREAVGHEREEMMKGFSEVRVALEVKWLHMGHRWGGGGVSSGAFVFCSGIACLRISLSSPSKCVARARPLLVCGLGEL